MSELLSVSVNKAAAMTGTSRTALYEAFRRKELSAVKRGRRTLILVSELRRWLESLPPVA